MKTSRPSKPKLLIGLFILIAAVGMAAVVISTSGSGDGAVGSMPTDKVRRGPLTISVTESGTITARDQVVIKSEVEGQATIIYLVPEGQRVNAGDLLIELDASQLQDNLVEQQIRVQNAEANFIRSRENLEVTKSQTQSDVKDAELKYELAKMDLKKYIEGEYPNQVREAESKITLAKEELERATEKVTWSEKLFSEKYISQTELEGDRLSKNRAELDHELASANLSLLKEYTNKRRIAELENAVTQSEMALDRVTRKAKADIIQAEADLKAKEAEFLQQQSRLKKIEEQLEKTKIIAPIAGMVVYATSAGGGWRGNSEPLDEGQTVRERQELIYLPTADAMMAEVKVHESNLQKVRAGLPVRVTVDALPGRTFQGRVRKIAPLPDAQSAWLNPDLKVFNTQIEITDAGDGLRTGMTCRAEIMIDHYQDALYVPLQAVVRVANKPTVYVRRGNNFVPQAIEVGLDNNRMIRVISGLEEGDEVLLTPPISQSVQEVDEAGEETMVIPPAEPAAPAPAPAAAITAPEAPANGAPAVEGQRPRFNMENMTEEQRNEMRQRFQNMSPEERERMRGQRQRGSNSQEQ